MYSISTAVATASFYLLLKSLTVFILENDYDNDYQIIMIIKIVCFVLCHTYVRIVTDINRLEITILQAARSGDFFTTHPNCLYIQRASI